MHLRHLLPVVIAACCATLAPPDFVDACAQQDPNFGKGPGSRTRPPDICFNTAEQEAEAIIRAGMIIRDHARACGRRGLDMGITDMWGKFDGANAQKLKEAVEIRTEAYRRNWPDDPAAAQRATNAIVASRQLVDFDPVECVVLRDMVGGFKTWDDFLKHVRKVEVGQVRTMYKLCPRGVRGAKRLQD